MNAGVRRDDTQTLHVSQSSDVTTQRYDERCRLSVALVELFLAGSGISRSIACQHSIVRADLVRNCVLVGLVYRCRCEA